MEKNTEESVEREALPQELDGRYIHDREEFNYELDRTTVNFLWDNLARKDFLFDSTNQKAMVLIAFNTFAMGGIVLIYDVLSKKTGLVLSLGLFGILVVCIASLVSIVATTLVLAPFRHDTGLTANDELSLIFHKDIVSRSKDQYVRDCKGAQHLLEDIVTQTYSLAGGLKKKYFLTAVACQAILYGHLFGFICIVIAQIIGVISDYPTAVN